MEIHFEDHTLSPRALQIMNHFIAYHKTINNLTSNDKGNLIITNKILANMFESVGKNLCKNFI
jgi:hypothetical protein